MAHYVLLAPRCFFAALPLLFTLLVGLLSMAVLGGGLDMPGLGHSQKPRRRDYSLERHAQDLKAVVDVAAGQPAVLVGRRESRVAVASDRSGGDQSTNHAGAGQASATAAAQEKWSSFTSQHFQDLPREQATAEAIAAMERPDEWQLPR